MMFCSMLIDDIKDSQIEVLGRLSSFQKKGILLDLLSKRFDD